METIVKQKVKFSIDVEVEVIIDLEKVQINYGLYNNETNEDFKLGANINEALNIFTERVTVDFAVLKETGYTIIKKEIEDVYNVHTRF